MPRLTVADTLAALRSTSQFEKISIAARSTEEVEDFILTLTESFGFDEKATNDLEFIVRGQVANMDYGFVQQIERIRESKNGFAALMFCLKHYGFEEVYDAMQKIFECDANKYSQIIGKLADFKDKIGSSPEKTPRQKRAYKKPTEVSTEGLTMVAQRKFVPGRATALRTQPDVLGVYAPNAVGGPALLEMVGVGFEKLPLSGDFQPHTKWNSMCRGIWSGTIRQLRKEYVVVVKNEGVGRLTSLFQ